MKVLKILALTIAIATIAGATLTLTNREQEAEESEIEVEEVANVVIRLSPEQIAASGLNVQQATRKNLTVTSSFPARIVISANRYAHIVPEASGLAREIFKNLGDSVTEGEILAVLESREVADAKAAYLTALRRWALTQNTLEREHRLLSKKITAEVDYQAAKNDAQQGDIELRVARQKLLALGVHEAQLAHLSDESSADLRIYELVAPFDGTVVERDIVLGELIGAGSQPFAVADLSTVWVEIGVHAKDIDKLRYGQTLTIHNPTTGDASDAEIIYLSPIVDSETRAARVIAVLENAEGKWRPGSFVRADVVTDTVDAPLTVPKSAIQRVEGEQVVFVQRDDGLEPRAVETGVSDATDVEILYGLQAGDCCATDNTFILKSELLKSNDEE